MHRRDLLQAGTGAAAFGLFGAAALPSARAADPPPAVPAPGPFDGSTVRRLAQALAGQPYKPPATDLPGPIDALTYDQYRGIRFLPERALWRGANLAFQVQFFHRGFLYRPAVDIFEVAEGKAAAVPYSADAFAYADPKLRVPDAPAAGAGTPPPPPLGYAGFRVHTRFGQSDDTEFCVFLGASYFRAVAKDQGYGLSARGLAIGTGNPRGEEFARFRAFWLERPQPGVSSLVVHALLDSESVTGAYRFTIRPGEATVFDVESALYPRADIPEPGIAVLTSMYDFGPSDGSGARRHDDWRPEVHDSDGLLLWTGRGEQLWRPLANPVDLQFSAFGDANPRGFGAMQRQRAFGAYQDLEAQYGRRPSLWVEPIGDWGQGAVDLVEIPTPNETNDNIVAFWRPKDKLNAKGEYTYTYRLHWGWDTPLPTRLARVAATRSGAGGGERGSRVFVIDLVGDPVKNLPPDAKLRPEITASAGKVGTVFSVPNAETGGWRVSFELAPGDAKLSELRCVLMGEQGPVSETWIYRWTP